MRIAVIGGDGTGPEVVAEGLKVLRAVAKKVGLDVQTKDFNVSGDRYLAAGGNPERPTIPVIHDEEVAELRTFDAIYLGAVGHPQIAPGILEKGPQTSTLSSSARTPRASTPGWAASSTRARRRR
jgi:3-isopropylmalate dehydrogenase